MQKIKSRQASQDRGFIMKQKKDRTKNKKINKKTGLTNSHNRRELHKGRHIVAPQIAKGNQNAKCRRISDNTVTKGKRTKRQTIIYTTDECVNTLI